MTDRDDFKTLYVPRRDEGPLVIKVNPAVSDAAAALIQPITPKSRTEIEAEKASKPRPDLLPPSALAYAVQAGHPNIADAFFALAAYLQSRETEALGDALGCVLDELGDRASYLTLAGEIMGVGLRKHGPCTWRVAGTEQADPQCHYASAVRHMLEHCAGVTADPDSGRPPLLHAVCQLAILINLVDDPPGRPGENDGRAMV